jgi:hypothetical protein
MGAAIHQLTELLQFRPLSPLTPDPDEWLDLTGPVTSGAQLWQNRRDSAVFSINGGKTWYYVDGREPGPTL